MSRMQMNAVITTLATAAAILTVTLYCGRCDAAGAETATAAPGAAKPQPRWADPLLDAIESSDVAKVKALLAGGCDPKTVADERGSPLVFAAALGHKDIVVRLIDAGCDVNEAGDIFNSPLLNKHYPELADIEWEVYPSDLGRLGKTVTGLGMAALYGHLNVVQLLIDNGADVTGRGDDGLTALHYAAWNSHKEVAALLISKGARVRAMAGWHMEGRGFGLEPIHCAINSTEVTALLLDKGADINARDIYGETPLMKAVTAGNVDTVTFLLSRGSNVEIGGGGHDSPLLAALDRLERIEHYAMVHAEHRHSAKGEPEFRKYEAIARLLIEHGADVSISDKDLRETPLHLAAEAGSTEIVSLLIAKGAYVNPRGYRGLTPLDRAEGYSDVVALLRRHGALTKDELDAGATRGNTRQSQSSIQSTRQ